MEYLVSIHRLSTTKCNLSVSTLSLIPRQTKNLPFRFTESTAEQCILQYIPESKGRTRIFKAPNQTILVPTTAPYIHSYNARAFSQEDESCRKSSVSAS